MTRREGGKTRPAGERGGAVALVRDARAAWARGDYVVAGNQCRAALARRRNDPEALMLLSEILGTTSTIAEEIELVKRAVPAAPRDARLRAHLGQRLLLAGRVAEALAQFERAARLDPERLEAVAGAAAAHEGLNRFDRARRLVEPHVGGTDPSAVCAAVFMRVLLHDGELDEAIALGRRVAGAASAPSLPLRAVLFSLAKALERAGRYDEAFVAAADANRMLAVRWDAEEGRRKVELLVETYTGQRLAALPRPSAPSELPVLIVGMPRSGTTLTERIIHAHPDAHGAGELDAFRALVNWLAPRIGSERPYPACVDDLEPRHVDEQAAWYVDQLASRAPRAQRVTDKNPGNFMHLGLAAVLLPAGRIIHCRRDPVDTCLSCFLERFTPSQAPFATDLRHLGVRYRQYERLMRHWQETIDVPILEVRYEEMVAEPEAMTRRIIDFCGLPWDEACLRFHEQTRYESTLSRDQVTRPIYTSAVGRSERFGDRLDPLREALAEE